MATGSGGRSRGRGMSREWPIIRRLLVVLLALGVLVAGLLLPYVGGLGLAARHEASKFLDTTCNLQESQPPRKTVVYANDGKTVIATLFSQDRQPVPLTQVPLSVQQALVATEDRRFYSHHGVDMRGLLRSAVSTSSGDTQGGSTLTMQYVKQIRYYQAGSDLAKQQAAVDQNLNRKIEDAKCALYIENVKQEPKSTILDNYLNIAFFGENSYGIETAAQTYFGKHTSQLTLPESAMLVGLLRAPSEYDPFVASQAAAAKARRNEVLQNLVAVHDLSQAEATAYEQTPINLATRKPPVVREGCADANNSVANAAFFCDYAVNWLETTGGISDNELTTGGLKIVTTLDAKLQNDVQRRLFAAMPATSPMTAVLPVVDPKTGNVLAMATSKHYGNKSSAKDNTHTVLPVFTEYSAQGASTYKLFPLLTALSTGMPSSFPIQTPTSSRGYLPQNCETAAPTTNGDAQETYSANETLATATAKSSNTFYVALADQFLQCDLQPIITMATKLGIGSLKLPSGDGNFTVAQSILTYQRPAELVLGDIPTSPLEMAGAYAAIANGGTFNAPAPIVSITDENGDEVAVKRIPSVQAVSQQVAAQAVQILSSDTSFPGTSAQVFQPWYSAGGSVVAGKTGTSVAVVSGKDTAGNAALWFAGMTPNMVGVTSIQNFDSPNAPAAGLPNVANPAADAYGSYSAGIWLAALGPSLQGQHWTWPAPESTSFGDLVPSVIGQDLATAKRTLAAAGFQMVQLDQANSLECSSSLKAGVVAYYAPQTAPTGSQITVCPSSGQPQTVFVARPPTRTGTTPPGTHTTPGTTTHTTPAPPTGGPPTGHGRGH